MNENIKKSHNLGIESQVSSLKSPDSNMIFMKGEEIANLKEEVSKKRKNGCIFL